MIPFGIMDCPWEGSMGWYRTSYFRWLIVFLIIVGVAPILPVGQALADDPHFGFPFALNGTGPNAYGSAIGDLNGDGANDLLVTGVLVPGFPGAQLRPVQIFFNRNDQTGTFLAPVDLPGSTGDSHAVVIADLNGDSFNDIVLTRYLPATNPEAPIRYYLNTPANPGTFSGPFNLVSPVSQILNSSAGLRVAVADLTDDGLLDIVVGNDTRPAEVFANNGDTPPTFALISFLPPNPTAATLPQAFATLIGDLDGDTIPDVVLANIGVNGVPSQIYLGTGGGTFDPPFNLPASGQNTFGGVLVDLNSDGLLDIVLANATTTNPASPHASQVYLNTSTVGNLSFAAPVDLPDSENSFTRAVGASDVNGDGAQDLMLGNFGPFSQVYINRNDGSGTFVTPVQLIGSGTPVSSLALGDLNGDTQNDLVLVNRPILDKVSPTNIFLSNRGGTFSAAGFGAPISIAAGFDPNAPVDATTGRSGKGVLLGDVNADGALDMLVVNAKFTNNPALKPSQLVLGKNNPTSSFSPVDLTGTGLLTFDGAFGDLNGDGLLDIALANSGDPSQVLLNVPSAPGTFAQPINLPGPIGTGRSVALADLNNDGLLDIVLGFQESTTPVSYFLNIPANPGTFSAPVAITGTNGPTLGIAASDLNGDGRPDLVLANYLTQASQVVINQGGNTPTFAVTDLTASGRQTDGVALGDVNGDQLLDIVLANFGLPSQVYLNAFANPGSFGAPRDLVGSGNNSIGVGLGDLNSDGQLDIVLGNYAGQLSQVFLNTGSGQFGLPSSILGSGRDTTRLSLGDVNADGAIDVVLGNAELSSQIFLNTNASGFSTATAIAGTGSNSIAVAVGDLNGDGALDLLLANNRETSQIALNRNDGSGRFALPTALAGGAQPTRGAALADLDADGKLDIILGNHSQPSQIYLQGANGFTLPTPLVGSGGNTQTVATGDLNGDNLLDLVLANANQPSQVFYSIPGAPGTFGTPVPLPDSGRASLGVRLADLNADGLLDIVLANFQAASQIYLNDGTGSFAQIKPSDLVGSNGLTNDAGVADVNGDGTVDIVLSKFRQPSQVILNGGVNGFAAPVNISGTGNFSNRLAIADLNGDGAPDVVLTNAVGSASVGAGAQPSQVLLNRNDGTGLFSTPLNLTGGVGFLSTATGDLNGDGAVDIVFAAGVGIVGSGGPLSQVYFNGRTLTARLPVSVPTISVSQPIGLPNADNNAAPQVVSTPTTTVTYTLANRDGIAPREVRASYSLDGGNSWRPAIAATGSITSGMFLFGSAPQFNGVNQSLSVPTINGLPTGNQPHTIEVWLRVDQFPTTQAPVLQLGNAGVAGQSWVLKANGTLEIAAAGGTAVPVPLTVGTWAHVAATFDGASIGVYLNGVPIGTTAATFDLQGTPLVVAGTPASGEQRFAGSIDELRIWSTSRTLEQIQSGVRAVVADTSTGLVAAYHFSEAQGANVSDSTPHANTATLSAGTAWIAPALPFPFVWNVRASGLFGQSNAARLRLEAIPSTKARVGGTSGPYQRPFATATSFPFAVRGNPIQVLDAGQPASDAIVLRRPAGPSALFSLVAASSSAAAFRTDTAGFLRGRGTIAVGDELIALHPLTSTGAYSGSYTLYHTNITPTTGGVQGTTIAQLGQQTLNVSADRPLLLFNLVVSLEWDARNDERFKSQLKSDLARTSELLFTASGGQIALGPVAIYQDKENWDFADVRIYATNRLRPNAIIGGVVGDVITDSLSLQANNPILPALIYAPGQVRMGAVWNRFGNPAAGSLSEDWPRTLAHELGHYLLFLDDNYVGLDNNNAVTTIDTCPGIMSDPYVGQVKFRPELEWLSGCGRTFSNLRTAQNGIGRADWQTISTFYPGLKQPQVGFSQLTSGPVSMPLEVTEIQSIDPLTPTERLDVPIFYTFTPAGRYLPTRNARAYLFQQTPLGPRMTSLGRSSIDQVLARGARVGDELCLFDPGFRGQPPVGGCEQISTGDERLNLANLQGWNPDVRITPVTSVTLSLEARNLPADVTSIQARLFPVDDAVSSPAAQPLIARGGGVYSSTITFAKPVSGAFARITANSPNQQREVVSEFALDGNSGAGFRAGGGAGFRAGGGAGFRAGGGSFLRAGAAPVSSVEGDVMMVADDVSFGDGQFLLLQSTTALPLPPPWGTVIGSGYRFTTSKTVPNLSSVELQFNYLGSEVPPGEETGIRVYFMGVNATTWLALPTRLDNYHNQASVRFKGPGLYALMSSIDISLYGGSWNLFAYPVQGPDSAPAEALASVAGAYDAIYGYYPQDTADPWKVYSPNVPAFVNDLTGLTFGQGYWINVTSVINQTLQLRGGVSLQSAVQTQAVALPIPPATYYGRIVGSGSATPKAGQQFEAWVGATRCGRATTQAVGGAIVYAVDVSASVAGATCAVPGQRITFRLNGRNVGSTVWDNNRIHQLDLASDYRVQLSLIVR